FITEDLIRKTRIRFDPPRLPQMPPLMGDRQTQALAQCDFDRSVSGSLYSRATEVDAVGVSHQVQHTVLESHELRHYLIHRDVGWGPEAAARLEPHSHRRFHRANHQSAEPGSLMRAVTEPAVYPRAVNRLGED